MTDGWKGKNRHQAGKLEDKVGQENKDSRPGKTLDGKERRAPKKRAAGSSQEAEQ